MPLHKDIKIISQSKRQAQVNMRVPFGDKLNVTVLDQHATGDLCSRQIGQADPNRWGQYEDPSAAACLGQHLQSLESGEPEFRTIEDIKPKDSDYIYPLFRALSQGVVAGYWLDYSTPGMLEAAVSLLQGQTVYTDHVYWRVENWVGSVNNAFWDAEGAASGGVPGINAELKIDAILNPKIARGLLMKPPAIHSVSVTVVFEYEFSHPQLVEERRFWNLLGEEVDGEIVRLIVTKIIDFYEISLVYQGADRIAKRIDVDDEDDGDGTMSVSEPDNVVPIRRNETMKLTEQQKQALGITHEGDDVPENLVVPALDKLISQASQATTLMASARAETTRVARLAILGAEDGELPKAIVSQINNADAEGLTELTEFYTKQAAEKFPASSRSSEEDISALPKPQQQQLVMSGVSLH